MLRPTIRKRILAIAVGLIVLMAITSVLSTVMTRKIAHQLDELSTRYVEAGADKSATGSYTITYKWVGGGLFNDKSLRLVSLSR